MSDENIRSDDDAEELEDFSAFRTRKSTYQDAEMDITPMIDITFLLLIFFLVASKMEESADVQLPPARHGSSVSTQTSVYVTVARGDSDRARIFKGDSTKDSLLLTSTNLVDQEKELGAYIQAQFDADAMKNSVIINAEKGVQHREVARVAQAVGAVEGVHENAIQLHVAVLEVQ